jgi:hypothetical protein
MSTLAEKITLAEQLQDKLIQYMIVSAFNGSDKFNKYYKDVSALFSIRKALEFQSSFTDTFTNRELSNLFLKINEYYPVLDLADPTFINDVYSTSTTTTVVVTNNWNEYQIPITSNGITTLPNMPVDVSTIDKDTLFLFVNGDSVPYNDSISADGYNMVGTTLYWHYFYDLKTTDIVILKWRT